MFTPSGYIQEFQSRDAQAERERRLDQIRAMDDREILVRILSTLEFVSASIAYLTQTTERLANSVCGVGQYPMDVGVLPELNKIRKDIDGIYTHLTGTVPSWEK